MTWSCVICTGDNQCPQPTFIGEEKNDIVGTEKIDGEESPATLLDETESPAILECATPFHSQIVHDTTEEDGVPETSQKKTC